MKVVHVTFYYDKNLTREEDFLEQYYTVTGWSEALQRQGAEVNVISRFTKECHFKKNNVEYHFIKDKFGPQLRNWHLPLAFFKKIKELDADVIHLHHLSLCLQTFLLRILLNRKTAIVIQHHGGPLPGRKKRFIYNFFNRVADGFFFATVEQGKEWFWQKKQIKKVMPVMEGATFFNFKTRDTGQVGIFTNRIIAREKTGMKGNPIFIWVGDLITRKAPLTVLDGFVQLAAIYPTANLYMIYSKDDLLDQVKERISNHTVLKNHVRLLGKIPHDEIEMYYRSADYFVAGSFAEGSGYALSEALSCGCVPIVTSIPSFIMMTNEGHLGALWKAGNKESFVQAARLAANKPLQDESNACINFFAEHLSYDAIAKKAIICYQKAIDYRLQNRPIRPAKQTK
jgi:glycosyltransferase involved in cell wall biosynthesis